MSANMLSLDAAAIIHGAARYLLREVERLDEAYAIGERWDVLGDPDGSARADREEALFLATSLSALLDAASAAAAAK